mmetsp:Transcript_47156/g.74523  ORF Transcript_47156/g.74523 Transcript_47156/m.74523 type:complete len:201 (+) Transcript_47156:101-703(+)
MQLRLRRGSLCLSCLVISHMSCVMVVESGSVSPQSSRFLQHSSKQDATTQKADLAAAASEQQPNYVGPCPIRNPKEWALSMEGTLSSMQSALARNVIENLPSLKAKKSERIARDLYQSGMIHARDAVEAARKAAELKGQLRRFQIKNIKALSKAEEQLTDGLPGYPKLPDASVLVPPMAAVGHLIREVARVSDLSAQRQR